MNVDRILSNAIQLEDSEALVMAFVEYLTVAVNEQCALEIRAKAWSSMGFLAEMDADLSTLDYDCGYVYYRRALRLNPRHLDAWQGLMVCYGPHPAEHHDIDIAVDAVRHLRALAVALSPEEQSRIHSTINDTLARQLNLAERVQFAPILTDSNITVQDIGSLTPKTALSSDQINSLFSRARALQLEGSYVGAFVEYLSLAVEPHLPNSVQSRAWTEMGYLSFFDINLIPSSLDFGLFYWRMAITLDPDNIEAWYQILLVCGPTTQSEEALAIAAEAVRRLRALDASQNMSRFLRFRLDAAIRIKLATIPRLAGIVDATSPPLSSKS